MERKFLKGKVVDQKPINLLHGSLDEVIAHLTEWRQTYGHPTSVWKNLRVELESETLILIGDRFESEEEFKKRMYRDKRLLSLIATPGTVKTPSGRNNTK